MAVASNACQSVFASEAKQSSFVLVSAWIASSLSLPCANALRLSQAMTEDYTAAVVTPPSTTMVWPVMKVEASEAR